MADSRSKSRARFWIRTMSDKNMEQFDTIAYVPRRIFDLYEAAYAGAGEMREWGEDAQRIAREASDADHLDAERFMLLYENQDLHGPVKVVVVDDPALDRLYQVLPQKAH
ncbi:MAG: hypothetical protein CMN10_18145 [Roseobacter sp.]|nr:hypothetical protein [Roseobacter sp.]